MGEEPHTLTVGERPSAGVQTFVIADLRGYTRYSDEHGDEASARVTEQIRRARRRGDRGQGGAGSWRSGATRCWPRSNRLERGSARPSTSMPRSRSHRTPSCRSAPASASTSARPSRSDGGFRGRAINMAAQAVRQGPARGDPRDARARPPRGRHRTDIALRGRRTGPSEGVDAGPSTCLQAVVDLRVGPMAASAERRRVSLRSARSVRWTSREGGGRRVAPRRTEAAHGPPQLLIPGEPPSPRPTCLSTRSGGRAPRLRPGRFADLRPPPAVSTRSAERIQRRPPGYVLRAGPGGGGRPALPGRYDPPARRASTTADPARAADRPRGGAGPVAGSGPRRPGGSGLPRRHRASRGDPPGRAGGADRARSAWAATERRRDRDLVGRHRYRERLWGDLVVALYRSGRQGMRSPLLSGRARILADELGIDPSPELQRLQEQVLRQDPSLELTGEPSAGTGCSRRSARRVRTCIEHSSRRSAGRSP